MVLHVLLAILGLLSLAYFHFTYMQYNRLGKLVNRIPGPKTIPFFGNLHLLRGSLVRLSDLLREWGDKYYPVYRLWFGYRPIIHLRHPDDLEILLTSSKQIYKKFAYEQFYPWMKTGLLTSGGQKWHQRRKILTPTFHFNILKKYMEVMNEQGDQAIANIKGMGKETKLDLLPYCSRCTLNIICESAMGVALDNEKEKESATKYKNALYKMGSLIVYRMLRPYIYDWMVPFIPKLNIENKQVIKDLNDFTNKIVSDRREYHKATNYKYLKEFGEDKSQSDNVYMGKVNRLAMLDLLLAAEKDGLIDDEGIKEEVATFIFGGHDTTALGMLFTIMLFAENKEAQSQAREEVEEILKRKDGKLEMADLQEMKYLERCIKESIRIFPPIPSNARHITEDIQLKNVFLPKGLDVVIRIIDVHRDPKFWPEPEKFDPDRFLPDQIKKHHPFSYIPFSAGSRNCIGQKFAMMELKSLIARILHNFYLEPIDYTHDVKSQTDIVLRPSHPIYTKFIRIDRD